MRGGAHGNTAREGGVLDVDDLKRVSTWEGMFKMETDKRKK